ncbi:Sirohydrochlorin ferrochelatase [Galdieria sulphuraria]|nr:Sirohydrochlorin ferrochelatase [Galdieria sulphuraria]
MRGKVTFVTEESNLTGLTCQRALILIDHGSKLPEANDQLAKVASLVAKRCPTVFVTFAHMELAKPDLMEAFMRCVENNARSITVCPFFLFPGRHSTVDIPEMAKNCSSQFHNVTCRVVEPLGVHEKLVDIVLERAGFVQEGKYE